MNIDKKSKEELEKEWQEFMKEQVSEFDKLIIEKIPDNHKVFVEVFAGSCVISINKKPSETTIINDLDLHLITFWKVLQDSLKRKQLIQFLDCMLYSRTLWRELR